RIDISVLDKEESLAIEFRDNGYATENYPLAEEEKRSLDCMSLEWRDLKKLVRSVGGTLSCQHKPYKGNHFILHMPYQFHSHSPMKEEIILPAGNNIIPFSNLKKTKSPKAKA
ncbi:MAG TPA: hypothetical protein VMW10_09105, partial [Alphaproteobacteria bacterium]|nr:hypothetical protein [Alphaproteobacteria bacterium]